MRFESYIAKTDTCWLWTGAKTHAGYGFTRYHGRKMGAHRASYLIFKGEIPPGILVLHRCDVRHCVNPDHLFLGTHQDNTLDCVSKGRHPTGERSPHAKVTDSEVGEIRRLRNDGLSVAAIAVQFPISVRQIYSIIKYESRRVYGQARN